MCEGIGRLGLLPLIVSFSPIILILSTICFIYMAKFKKGKVILTYGLLFLILGFIPIMSITARILVILWFPPCDSRAIHHYIISYIIRLIFCDGIEGELKGYGLIIGMILTLFIDFLIVAIPIIILFGILGYACRKWRLKNNISLDNVIEKDIIVIISVFLLCNIGLFIFLP